jgi:hypothetical protein
MSELKEDFEVPKKVEYKKSFTPEVITKILDHPKILKSRIVRIVSTVAGMDTFIGLGVITDVDVRPLTFLISVEPIVDKGIAQPEKPDVFTGIPVHAFIAKHSLLEGLLGIYEYNNFKIYLG